MVGAFKRGLSLSDFNEMTIGMIIDYITTYNNMNLDDEDEEGITRDATQADFDAW